MRAVPVIVQTSPGPDDDLDPPTRPLRRQQTRPASSNDRLWTAAWSLHNPADPAAEDRVATWALALLAGHVHQVITDLEHHADTLPDDRRNGIDTTVGYLTNNAEHLRYDHALHQGWPIATGVIEGACRHLIADRFALAGARWGLARAEAMLKLRALAANNDLHR